ncbi:HAMP domain-containing sensor histidine kinase [Streptomyces sp. NPDC126499]|uniref:sensor histidine kinase n=1 Tax=Streptomyces sp. NPDC126499 TaxID=3155314 RepID=UPI00331BA90A
MSALTASLVVVAVVVWLQWADRQAGPLAATLPERLATDRIGPQIALLRRPGIPIGALAVAAACWLASRGHRLTVRLRTTVAVGAVAAALSFTQVQWIAEYGTTRPDDVAAAATAWALPFVAPTTGLVTGVVAWTALGGGARGMPFRNRLVLIAGATCGVALTGAVKLLRETQQTYAHGDTIHWVAVSTGVPAVALLTGLLTHLTAVQSLRPVEAIRRRLEHISGRSLDQRVPVPATDDVIADLARTTNRTLDRLEQASVRQRQFVADAAHELRSPLAGLRAQLESALRHPEGVEWPEVVGEAVQDVVRLQALANDLLLLARMDGAPRADAAEEEVGLGPLIEDLLREHRHLPVARGLDLDGGAPAHAYVNGNPAQLERLLRNLLDNACRHARSRVTVRCAEVGGARWELSVEDDGPGIPVADRERVFERFTRLDAARARSDGGAGLGLAIAREIAVRHGGTLAVADGDGDRGGARLVAHLPAGGRPAGGAQAACLSAGGGPEGGA